MRSNTRPLLFILILFLESFCVSGFPDFKPFSQAKNDIFDIIIITHEQNLNFANQFFGLARHAVHNLSIFSRSDNKYDLFCSTKAVFIIVQLPDINSFTYSMSQICSALQCNSKGDYQNHYRKPFVLLLWPEIDGRLSLSREQFETEITTSYITTCLQKENIVAMDSEFYIMVSNFEESEDTPYLIFEIYSILNQTILREILFHNQTHYFQPLARKLTRRHNFRGARLLTIAQATTEFFVMVKFDEDAMEMAATSGFDADYFNAMASSLNIRPIAIKGKGWIKSDGNGSLTGMGLQLLNGEGDIILSHSEYMLYRFKKLSFLHPHYALRLTAFFQQPTATATRDLYLRSIPNKLRFAIACTSLFALLCLVTISKIGQMFSANKDLSEHCLANIIHWMVAASCQQGCNIQPRMISMKIGVLVFSFFSVVVYIAFSTSVVSQLSVPFVPIKTFDDILKSNMNITLDGVTQTAYVYLDKAKEKMRLEGPTRTISPRWAVEKMVSEGLVFLTLGDEFYLPQRSFNYTDEQLCTLVSSIYVDPIGMPVLAGMLVPKSSPYKEFFKYKQIQMREVGVHNRLFNAYIAESVPTCQYIKSRKKVNYLGLNDTITAFVFLLTSFLISLILLCIERRMKKVSTSHYFDGDPNHM